MYCQIPVKLPSSICQFLTMLKAIFVVNNEPIVIVSKYQVPPKTNELTEEACKCIRLAFKPNEFKPIVHTPPHTFFLRQTGEVWLVCVVEGDSQAMMYTSMLERLEEILNQYIEKPLTDFGVKDNFALIYRIIDMFIDSSFPFVDDYNGLMQFIAPKNAEKGTLNPLAPWRASGPTYKKQQVLLDTTEYIDYMVGLNGKVDLAQVRGEIVMQADLNGSPHISLNWKNSPLFDDVAFHRSVDYQAYMSSKRIDLIPPQGKFTLVTYRMQTQAKPPLDIKAVVTPTRGKLDIRITVNVEKQANDVAIKFDIPGARDSTLQTKSGEIVLGFENCTWKIGRMKPGKPAELTGAVGCSEDCRQCVFIVSFNQQGLFSGCEITGRTLEGVTDNSLFVGSKNIVKNGKFQIRAGMQ